MVGKVTQLEAMFRPVVEALDCELWGIEYHGQGKKSMLRIYIDKQPDGVLIEDCEKVSRQLSSVLDVEDPIAGEYTLEVSSPGMDRPLFNLKQFDEFIGQIIEVRLRIAFENRRKFKGVLKGIEDEEVVLEMDGEEYLLPYELVDKTRVVPTFK